MQQTKRSRVHVPAGDRVTEMMAIAQDTAATLESSMEGHYELTVEQNEALLGIFDYFVERYSHHDRADLFKLMNGRLEKMGLSRLIEACDRDVPVFSNTDLRRVLAYTDFAREVLKVPYPIHVEVRIEGWKAYCLVLPKETVLRTVTGGSLLWLHDQCWAEKRFREGGEDLGLIGQVPGKSKFVSACAALPTTKKAALEALGLNGYKKFEEADTLHVVRAKMLPHMLQKARPMVPLLYNVGLSATSDAAAPETWAPAQHFQEGSMPGFTSGLKAELVIHTFKLNVNTLAELDLAGVTCVDLAD